SRLVYRASVWTATGARPRLVWRSTPVALMTGRSNAVATESARSRADATSPAAMASRATSTRSGWGRPVSARSRARASTEGGRSTTARLGGMPLVDAGLLRDMPTDRGRLVRAHGYAVAVFVVNGELRAVDDRCLHTGGPLADGWVVDGCVVCPWHGWVYDLATGERVVGARTTG